jgi:hypothetical protein
MSAIDRGDLRTALQTALTTALTKAHAVERYLAEPGKHAPLVTIGSRASGGIGSVVGANAFEHGFYVHILVPTGKQTPGLAQENAEDLLDDVRQQFDDWIQDGLLTVGVTSMTILLDGKSEVFDVPIGGERYLDEKIPIIIKTWNT